MVTRIVSLAIAIAFLLSALGVFAYFVWRYVSEEEVAPKTSEEAEAERLAQLANYGQLSNFTPLTQPLTKVELRELQPSEEETFIIETDIITFKYWYALAQNGQIFHSSSAQEDRPQTAGMSSFLDGLRQTLLDKRVGSTWRIMVPYKDINDYIALDEIATSSEIPADYDIVIDFEIVGIADRSLKGFLEETALEDFQPLPEALAEMRFEDRKQGSGTTANGGDTLIVNYIGVTAEDGEVFDQNNAFSFNLDNQSVIEGWVLGLEGMQVGGQRRIFIPAKNAYHTDPEHALYNKDLVFDVELLAVHKAPGQPGVETADEAEAETSETEGGENGEGEENEEAES